MGTLSTAVCGTPVAAAAAVPGSVLGWGIVAMATTYCTRMGTVEGLIHLLSGGLAVRVCGFTAVAC